MDYQKWIPDFTYELVRIHDYSNEELLKREDEMSLIMLFNKVQNASGLDEFLHIPAEKISRIVKDSPGHVLDILVSVMESLCFKIDASEEERTECVRKVKARNMGYLGENAEQELRNAREKLRLAEETIQKLMSDGRENR